MMFPMITAHSGCEGVKRDSIESVKKGLELNAEAVEVDVQIDRDGILRLSHDGREDYSDAEILAAAFDAIAGSNICINCDLKDFATLLPVLKLADKFDIPKNRLIISGNIDCKLLAGNPEISGRARIFLNEGITYRYLMKDKEEFDVEYFESHPIEMLIKYADMYAEFFKSTGVDCLNICYERVNHELIERFRVLGIPVSVWTVDKEELQRYFLNENLLNITTMRPASALKIREEFCR